MLVAEAIRQKRAIRTFAARPIGDEEATAILNAGRRAQSSKNTQPWSFVAVRERATLQALTAAGPYAEHLGGAALAVVILTPDPAQLGIPSTPDRPRLMQLAWDLGIGSCGGLTTIGCAARDPHRPAPWAFVWLSRCGGTHAPAARRRPTRAAEVITGNVGRFSTFAARREDRMPPIVRAPRGAAPPVKAGCKRPPCAC
jgi:hypothetical protein